MIKLWTAQISVKSEVVIAADSEIEAKSVFDLQDILDDGCCDINVYWSEIKEEKDIPCGWSNSEPYGEQDGTCKAIILGIEEEKERQRIEKELDNNQLKLGLDT